MTTTAPTPVDGPIGRPLDRVEGHAKVTGTARYAAEVPLPGLTHAVLVGARVARGRITSIDAAEAERAEGVLAVLTHENLGKIAAQPPLLPSLAGSVAPGETFFPMQGDEIHYAGQHVALVVADTYERALHASRLVRISYAEEPSVTVIDQGRDQAYEPEAIFAGFVPGRTERGDVEAALGAADVTVDRTFTFAANHHNPIETSAATAYWEGDRLTLHDTTQGVTATQHTVAALLGVPHTRIRVIGHFTGGSFGGKAMVWHHPALAALAARKVGRPVRLALTREQMFVGCGHREEQEQRLTLGADKEGRLVALRHHKLSPTSPFDHWAEPSLGVAGQLYACPNYEGVYRLIRANTTTPTFMRCPGEATGLFALETAMDELAERVDLDPLELRLRNYTENDPASGRPWSSNGLRECLERGAERIGWERRAAPPARDGDWLIGLGMAASAYPVYGPNNPQRARARLYADGTAVVQAAVTDIGTGVLTVMTQVAAEALGLPVERCRFEGGDTDLPNVAAAVGSSGAGMVSATVHAAASALREQLVARAVGDEGSPLHGADPADVDVRDGRMVLRDAPGTGEDYAELLQRNFLPDMEATGSWGPPPQDAPFASMTFGAQFAEVAVDPVLGLVRVRRLAGAFAPGRVLNAKTARSQLMGGMIWGLSQALLEATHMEPRTGRWANASLGEYLVPVNADAPDVDVDFIEVQDTVVNPLGVKGVGEVGQAGVAPAIANAIHHAIGRRLRKLPITIEDIVAGGDEAPQ
ncbi:xanthine dehydrogenase family protein molybdopterin-binding subunit [Streptomyces aurantiacus]|uniref:Putative xanthine dehydrogenase YagR molybdenum-binding subunit n=1 Tax=Streptomyces aurantiacus JA 4570 TaxID=1286094 RepID=S3ZNN4_9ACTN|nr:xanthine dehydrogenase family protein molybdopterin-binding subunit [Streptomyces aurantiacus]EPH44414.1 putative xanthine dehydrogenase YagR molybdenum-binding subunit [Streptomyces aurantiacus JA 4570]